ncbi:hypothetical protein GJ744_003083 [Endocarpon pusillum]|uniref:Biogenesis of lysosome-related organelles complex 1 subunit 1 n=1 Tax=Endocarpon pusillum TaxID=364733 RepID=A0A8H7AVF1_9EURO|nr:hypothetical protein GJ744_003083 [Endocarpon pusillum]
MSTPAPPASLPTSTPPPPPTTSSPSEPQPQPAPANQVSAAQRTAEARTAFTAHLRSAAANLDADLQSRAKNIHANAQALQKQERHVDREIKGLRRCNEQLEGVVGAWKGEWGREMARLGVVQQKRKDVERERERDGGDGEFGEFDLGGIERELGVLEDWVRIVEEGG